MAEPSPQTFRLAVSQAKTLVFTLDVEPAASVAAWEVAFYLRRKSGALLVTKTSDDDITCTDPLTGEWEVALAEEDSAYDAGNDPTATINGKTGLYDWAFWRTDDGSETPLAYGSCTVYRTARSG